MKKRLAIAALALIASASCLLAGRPGVVKTSDGATYEGDVTERADEVVIKAHGVDTVLPRDRVASVDYTAYQGRFEEALASLKADDVTGRVALARDAFDRHDYANAMRATESAIDIDPLNHEARQLESLISTQVQLEGREAATQANESVAEARLGDDPTTRPGRRIKELDDDQINRIRQVELSRDDHVRVQFRNNVRKRFVDSQPGMSFQAFASREDIDQALTILARGSQDMTDDVRIRGDPLAVQTFGRKIQTALVQGCASSNCHGGSGAGSFRLISGPPDAATMITNFYLVTQYAKKIDSSEMSGPFSPPTVPMVARGDATNSLLYQYALPRSRAKHKHPAVRGWDGLIRADDDRLARDLVEWMNTELERLHPSYGFTYAIEGGHATAATTDPTTMPTTMPTTGPATQANGR